ncbi:monovalent cation/H(+) antiporter subunit G [Mangrovibacillus cuniculi]|uniref:Na+/H+ antiporter subunit G n=1 Tax=Mangrovibacillus cuniculi TaxID=2593652 RepID=A0A7S8CC98_9BACI|nr:monovalent cation/H(+) antiporter subunit G [Mangrovibacillus cuniculi]QPC47350.1 Na+/H+ antiporter subunit G [Mangrovibacillus cuniculi]
MIVINSLIIILTILGSLFALLAAVGVLRFPDVYTRNHAASKSATLGITCILLATFLYFWFVKGEVFTSTLLGIFFILLTAPVAGQLIARAAYYSGVKLWDKSGRDDLKEKAKAYQTEH